MKLLAIVLLCAACTTDLTTTDGVLSMTVPETSVAAGGTITATVSNQSRSPYTTFVELPCGSPFERKVGDSWERLVLPIRICAGGAVERTLAPDSAWTYSWPAPQDAGTYRATVVIGSLTLISHAITVW